MGAKSGPNTTTLFVLPCSPSGKLVQIEYALNAVNAGATSLGIKGTSPCVTSRLLAPSESLIDELIAEIDSPLSSFCGIYVPYAVGCGQLD